MIKLSSQNNHKNNHSMRSNKNILNDLACYHNTNFMPPHTCNLLDNKPTTSLLLRYKKINLIT